MVLVTTTTGEVTILETDVVEIQPDGNLIVWDITGEYCRAGFADGYWRSFHIRKEAEGSE